MAKLKARISKADHEGLDEALQGFYVADGDGFKLDSDHEDVDGLKAKRDELLRKLAGFKEFEGLDPKEVKDKLAALAEKETADAVAKGKWEELETRLKEKHRTELDALTTKLNNVVSSTAKKDLQLALVASGVKENLAEDLAISLTTKNIKHVEDGGRIVWKTMDDTETVDLSTYIPSLKESKADYFKSDLGSGSGASGSGNSGSSSSAVKWTRNQWDTATTEARSEFSAKGGQVTD